MDVHARIIPAPVATSERPSHRFIRIVLDRVGPALLEDIAPDSDVFASLRSLHAYIAALPPAREDGNVHARPARDPDDRKLDRDRQDRGGG